MHLDALSPCRILKDHGAVTTLAVCDQEIRGGCPCCSMTAGFFSVGVKFDA